VKTGGGLTEAQFNAVIDKFEAIYAPVVASLGERLNIMRKWNNGMVNADAMQLWGTWDVSMYGGLARHETITVDGFSLVLCHEIGHHIGGAPKVSGLIGRWASNEGQADYWAMLKCLRTGWAHDDNEAIISKMKVPKYLKDSCQKIHPEKTDLAICIREGMAGLSVARLYAAIEKKPEAKLETPDRSVVSRTDDGHPAYQCRLDTFFQGSLCEKSFLEDVSPTDEVKGTCHKSTGQTVGLRPLCWFKPKVY
jgi:hypothetical protein